MECIFDAFLEGQFNQFSRPGSQLRVSFKEGLLSISFNTVSIAPRVVDGSLHSWMNK